MWFIKSVVNMTKEEIELVGGLPNKVKEYLAKDFEDFQKASWKCIYDGDKNNINWFIDWTNESEYPPSIVDGKVIQYDENGNII